MSTLEWIQQTASDMDSRNAALQLLLYGPATAYTTQVAGITWRDDPWYQINETQLSSKNFRLSSVTILDEPVGPEGIHDVLIRLNDDQALDLSHFDENSLPSEVYWISHEPGQSAGSILAGTRCLIAPYAYVSYEGFASNQQGISAWAAGSDQMAVPKTTASGVVYDVTSTKLTGTNYADHIDGDRLVESAVFSGLGGNDYLRGGGGDDFLTGGLGADEIDGGGGNDTADFGDLPYGVTVDMMQVTDDGSGRRYFHAIGTSYGGVSEVDSLTSIENLRGTGFSDWLIGDANSNILLGCDGDDTLSGGLGIDTLDGGGGNDTLISGGSNDALDGGKGIDLVDYSGQGQSVTVNLASGTAAKGGGVGDTLANIENITGTAYNDNLTGDTFANVLVGGDGNDILLGGAGDDTLLGGLGNDTLGSGDGKDVLDGGAGIDVADYSSQSQAVTVNLMIGTAKKGGGVDALAKIENVTGTAYNDSLTGDASANMLAGGAGNDTLRGGLGNDTLNGGAGNNTADYSDAALDPNAGIEAVLGLGLVNTGHNANGVNQPNTFDRIVNIQNIVGTRNVDSLYGDGNANMLDGGAGDDYLSAYAGNDTLISGIGNDVLDGGTGTDVANYSAQSQWIDANLASGRVVKVAGGVDRLWNIENVTGTAQNDTLAGDAKANQLAGGAGNDTYVFRAGGGADTIVESAGQDTMTLDAGSQQLWFRHVGNDLQMNVLGTTDAVLVKNWYSGSGGQVETIRAGDGKVLLNTQVDALVAAMASYTMPAAAPVNALPNYATNLQPAMSGWH